ncbi:very short patch repair endonuclease [Massilia sp. MB5]|uniref:very short patch repair endonuclease n=1 Tax=Massilia sp. MB5 TaxID=2919578 RepID=UPI001F117EA1|nr:very short patch repair endonuclease [Massilia sp. MB5]UMR33289.1 very short patch repair endonuclease [Massilia sp. MB5]
MSRVKSKNTSPELLVGSLLRSLGFNYRLHVKTLPGTPDFSNKRRKKAIFVHGCFWHRHPGCKRATMPVSNVNYWTTKFFRNVTRDQSHIAAYARLGWVPLIVWECETANEEELKTKLAEYLLA